jgi:uncharacterized protein YfaS (alpha-2-macroglobulin family)
VLYLISKHFPDRATAITPAQLDKLAEPIFQGRYNTFSSAFTILALEAYGKVASKSDAEGGLSIAQTLPSGKQPISLPASMLPVVNFSSEASALSFGAKGDFGAYWLLEQRGFDRAVPNKALSQKVEIFREYTDESGKPVDKVAVGDEIRVHVRVRALGKEPLYNLAITDLLPGGFEVVMQEKKTRDDDGEDHAERGEGTPGEEGGEGGRADEVAREGDDDTAGDDTSHGMEREAMSFALPITVDGTTMSLDYGDVREDRVVLYTSAESSVSELVYVLKATNVGTYRTAPALVDSMYDRSVLGRSTGGKIVVYRK